MAYTLRTKIKKEIIAEFLPPIRKSNKVIILCGGMPSYPGKAEVMLFLAKKGYWVFSFRYRGSWESNGLFLKKSPHLDVIDVINSFSSGFIDLWKNKKYKIKNPEVYIIGVSFGGPAAILASLDKRVKKIIAFSPVIDWKTESKSESINKIRKFTKIAFRNCYRFKQKDWDKLKNGVFYNPIAIIKKLDKKKIYIIHAEDDKAVSVKPAIKFAKTLGCKITILKKGGHLSTSNLLQPIFWKYVNNFFRTKNSNIK